MILPKHIKAIDDNPSTKLVALCDTIPERVDKYAKETGSKAYYDYAEMLKNPDIDVVSICTPNGLHSEMSIAAMNAGKHVLCEKPMTLNTIDAERIVETNKKTGKSFFLVKQNRYNPPIMALKGAFLKNQLGKVFLINATVYWNRNEQYYADVDWRGTLNMDGGALFTQSSHFLDLMVWLGGDVKSVTAVMNNVAHPSIETEDLGLLLFKFKNGTLGTLQYTTAVYEKNFEGTIGVLGTKGTVKIGGKYLNELEFWNVEGVPEPKLEPGEPPNNYGSDQGSMSNHGKVYGNVSDVLGSGAKIATPSNQGQQSVEIMQAAWVSATKNKEVFLPLKGDDRDFSIENARLK